MNINETNQAMRFLYPVIFFFLYTSSTLFGQYQDSLNSGVKQSVKIGLNKIINHQLFLGYEYKFAKNFTLNSQFGILKKAYYIETIDESSELIRTDKTPFSQFINRRTKAKIGIQINLDLRTYPFAEMKGFFLGIKGGYQYVDFGTLIVSEYESLFGGSVRWSKEITTGQNTMFLGFITGANISIKKRQLIEFYFFIGTRNSKLTTNEILEPNTNLMGRDMMFLNRHFAPIKQFEFEFGIFYGIKW